MTVALTNRKHAQELTPSRALWQAWLWWFTLLLLPFFALIVVLWTVMLRGHPNPNPTLGNLFFSISLAWMLVMIPGAFVLRNYIFRAYWDGSVVDPRSYLKGMITIWLAPEIGGLIALIGCLISQTLLPGLLAAAVAFMLFVPFWPNGSAMIEPVGDVDDDEIFRHPR